MNTAGKSRLLDQLRTAIRVPHDSLRTEKSHVYWVRLYIRFHNMRHPREMWEPEIEAFPGILAEKSQVSAATQNQALNALVFLYKRVLDEPLGEFFRTMGEASSSAARGAAIYTHVLIWWRTRRHQPRRSAGGPLNHPVAAFGRDLF